MHFHLPHGPSDDATATERMTILQGGRSPGLRRVGEQIVHGPEKLQTRLNDS
jgi:hypothetical protein